MTIESEKNAPSARATLADVRPGGRVRLGDASDRVSHLKERIRWTQAGYDCSVLHVGPKHFNARYVVSFGINENSAGFWIATWENENLEPRRIGCFASEEEAKGACLVDAVKEDNDRYIWDGVDFAPALSAQPSPGGQDALATARELLAAEYDKAGERVFADRARKGQYDNDPDVHAIVTALAARQPVGISAEWVLGYLTTDAPEDSREAIRNAFTEYAALSAARQPSKQPDSVALGEATEFCIEKGARQPVHGSGTLVDSGALQMALNVLRRAGKDEVADALESTAARQPVGEQPAIPEGWALVDLAEYTVLPQIPTTAMMDAGWPIGEQITDQFDVKGAYADLIAEHEAKGEGIIHGPIQVPAQAVDLGAGVKAIAAERERQLQAEGFSRDCDQQYREGELARAATAYVQLAAMDLQVGTRSHIALQEPPFFWPWAPEWWKPVDARRDLVRAGALIAAQIDLIDSQAVGK